MKVIRKKNAPDFLIVGSAKSGTTSLWYYLDQHPDIFMNKGVKELGYFSDHYGISDLDEYLKFFDEAEPGCIIGEACHAYLTSKESPGKIYDFNPNMKIVMILRDPVYRSYSLYNWMVENGYERTSTFREALALEDVRLKDDEFINNNEFYFMNYLYFNSGLYFEQVKRYKDVFPNNNIHIIIYESFRENNQSIISDLFRFLSVDDSVGISIEKKNVSNYIRSAGLQWFLKSRYQGFADACLMPRRISKHVRSLLLKINKKRDRPKSIESDLYQVLRERYTDDIGKLSNLIGVDLFQYWTQPQ